MSSKLIKSVGIATVAMVDAVFDNLISFHSKSNEDLTIAYSKSAEVISEIARNFVLTYPGFDLDKEVEIDVVPKCPGSTLEIWRDVVMDHAHYYSRLYMETGSVLEPQTDIIEFTFKMPDGDLLTLGWFDSIESLTTGVRVLLDLKEDDLIDLGSFDLMVRINGELLNDISDYLKIDTSNVKRLSIVEVKRNSVSPDTIQHLDSFVDFHDEDELPVYNLSRAGESWVWPDNDIVAVELNVLSYLAASIEADCVQFV